MIKRIQSLPRWQRIIVFIGLVLLVVAGMVAITLPIVTFSYNDTPRSTAVAMLENITVREFAQLPDANAYPAALTITSDGTLFTGSYVNGMVWRISPEGSVSEIPGTGATIGAITGLDVAADGTLYILDRRQPLETQGAVVWRLATDGTLEQMTEADSTMLRLPYDLAVDTNQIIYVSDAHPQSRMIWRYSVANQTLDSWWQLPEGSVPTRLFYNADDNTLLVADTGNNRLYQAAINAANPADEATLLYEFAGDAGTAPGLDGVVVAPNKRIFVAALGLNRVAQLNPETKTLDYLAGAFRGSSDLAYDAARQRLYVTNWEQRALLPQPFLIFQIDILPHLPFALDVIEWKN